MRLHCGYWALKLRVAKQKFKYKTKKSRNIFDNLITEQTFYTFCYNIGYFLIK